MSQQVDRAVPNATQFGGQCDAVKRTLGSGADCPDKDSELVCKRQKLLFDKVFSQLLFPCGFGHFHDS